MGFSAKILADSISPSGVRLTTLEVTFPRIILAEFNTHRMLSRNSASSRAIPVEKRIDAVLADPFIPEAFGANKKGMQAGEDLSDALQKLARAGWMKAMHDAVDKAQLFKTIGVHKQWANRLLEPFGWHTAIISATAWTNFFALRCSPEAQPEIRTIAEMMRDVMQTATPRKVGVGEWHLPFISYEDHCDEDGDVPSMRAPSLEERIKLSVARCARVSYLTHDGKRDPAADLVLYDRLLKSGHMSPFEHAAMVGSDNDVFDAVDGLTASDCGCSQDPRQFIGNFQAPWIQHRKMLPNEAVFQP